MPRADELPPTDLRYDEIKTAKAFGYRWGDWLREAPVLREQMMAHELHRAEREAYYCERVTEFARSDRKKPTPHADQFEAIKTRWGIKY